MEGKTFTINDGMIPVAIFYPDIASFQAGVSLKGTVACACKITQSTNYLNPDYSRARRDAAANGVFFFAYHFLVRGNAIAQASWCFSHAGKTPLMVDFEPTTGSNPTLKDCLTFIDAYRQLGGIVHLVYLPKWYHQQLGSPSLQPLVDRDMALVSSDYTTYSDNGPGWAPYGGMTPKIWQYTDHFQFNGFSVDFNAFKGSGGSVDQTIAEFKSVVNTGHFSPPAPPPPSDGTAVNPVTGLKVTPRYTQAVIDWKPSPGATSYRVNVWTGLPRVSVKSFERTGTKTTIHDLKPRTKYTVTVLAKPARLTDTLAGRARASFTTK